MGPCICHTQQTRRIVLQYEILVGKFVTIDAKAAGPVTVQKVTTLAHKVLDDAMEKRTFIPHGLVIHTGISAITRTDARQCTAVGSFLSS